MTALRCVLLECVKSRACRSRVARLSADTPLHVLHAYTAIVFRHHHNNLLQRRRIISNNGPALCGYDEMHSIAIVHTKRIGIACGMSASERVNTPNEVQLVSKLTNKFKYPYMHIIVESCGVGAHTDNSMAWTNKIYGDGIAAWPPANHHNILRLNKILVKTMLSFDWRLDGEPAWKEVFKYRYTLPKLR